MKIKLLAALLMGSGIIAANAQIVKNGSFENWVDGKPVDWQLGQGTYEQESTAKIDGQYALRAKTDPDQKALFVHSKVYQVVDLKPHHRYKLSCYMCKDSTGTHAINLIPLQANGKLAPKPLFSIRSWSWPLPYTCFAKEFTTGSAKQYRLEILQYANGKFYTYLDKIEITPLDEKSQSSTGFGVFTQSPMLKFSDDRLSEKATALDSLSFTLTRNETETQTVILRAGNTPISKTDIITSGSLQSSSGQTIPAANITIRSNIDSVLPLSTPRDLSADKLACWQIFVKTTPDTVPGQYTGKLLLQSNGKTLKTIPLSVEVVDIVLPAPDITFGTYHAFAYFPAQYISIDYLRKIFVDMKNHGMNSVTIYNNPEKTSKGVPDYDHNQQYNSALIPEKYRNWSKKTDPMERYDSKAWTNRFNIGLREEMNLGVETGLLTKKHPILWLVTKGGHYSWGGISTDILSQVLAYWKTQKNWPEPLLYVVDEPSGMPEREALARLYFDRIAKAGIKVKTVTAHPDPDTLGHLYDVWILGANKVNYRNFAKAVKMNRGFWMYNCSIPNDNAPYFRAMYGFSAYASNVSGVWSWAYYDARVHFVSDAEGNIKDTSSVRLSKVGLSPEGPVPTVAWEAMRDGTEDYRLAQLFSELYHQADKKYRAELAEVSKVLSDKEIAILKKIDKQKYSKPGSGKTETWTTSTPEKQAAAEKFSKLIDFEQTLSIAYRAKSFLIDMIPNTLAPGERVAMYEWKTSYAPELGETDRITAAETKRMALIPVIIKLQNILNSK